jgi:hypothetical protein
VIKHKEYAKYVGEDPAALLHCQWNRGRRWAALHTREREREEHLGFRQLRVVVDVGMASMHGGISAQGGGAAALGGG